MLPKICSRKPVSRPPTSSVQSLLPSIYFPPFQPKILFCLRVSPAAAYISLPSSAVSPRTSLYILAVPTDDQPFFPLRREKERGRKSAAIIASFFLLFWLPAEAASKKRGSFLHMQECQGRFSPFPPTTEKGGRKKGSVPTISLFQAVQEGKSRENFST